MSDILAMTAVVREAVRSRKQLYFVANDHPREFCPHVLGTKQGKWHVFGWQFGGTSSSGALPNGGDWRCIELEDISSQIEARDGEWYRGWTKGKRGSSCVDEIDISVDPAYAAEIRNTSPMRTR